MVRSLDDKFEYSRSGYSRPILMREKSLPEMTHLLPVDKHDLSKAEAIIALGYCGQSWDDVTTDT